MVNNRIFAFVGIIAASISLHITTALAASEVILNLHENKELLSSIKSYFEGDPECRSCRGGKKDSNVELLQLVHDTDKNLYYFQGFVWANSYHPDVYPFGGVISGAGNEIQGPGLLKIDFRFPVALTGNVWTPNYNDITNLAGSARVERVSQKELRFVNPEHNNFLVYAVAEKMFPQYKPSARVVEIDLEQIFERSKSYLPTQLNLPSVPGSFPEFKNRVLVANLKTNQDLVNLLKSYFEADPRCHSCRGGARTSGVQQLHVIRDSVSGQYYLKGLVWANSYHPHGLTYGQQVEVKRRNFEGPSLLKVDFLLPMSFDGHTWVANYDQITKRASSDSVSKVNRLKIRFNNRYLDNRLTYWIANMTFRKLRPSADTVEIDLEQVFEISKPFIESLNLNATASPSLN